MEQTFAYSRHSPPLLFQEEEVVMVAGVDVEVWINLDVKDTLHRPSTGTQFHK